MLVAMVRSIFILLGSQVVGELLAHVLHVLHVPVPGPVMGLVFLAALLHLGRQSRPGDVTELGRVTRPLLGTMGLFFVPAGVGVVAAAEVLRREWMQITTGLLGSTLAAMVVTAWVMEWATRQTTKRARGAR